jgi:hypothetical protein
LHWCLSKEFFTSAGGFPDDVPRGFDMIQAHAEHPHAANVLFSSQISCLAMPIFCHRAEGRKHAVRTRLPALHTIVSLPHPARCKIFRKHGPPKPAIGVGFSGLE